MKTTGFLATITTFTLATTLLSGCAGLFSSLGRSSSGGGGPARTYTFTNRTSNTLCQVWFNSESPEQNAVHSGELAPGASVQLSLRGPVSYVFATECGSARTLAGFPDSMLNPRRRPLNAQQPQIALNDSETTSSPELYNLAVSPSSTQDWLEGSLRMIYGTESTPEVAHDQELAAAALQRIQQKGRREGWPEHFFVAIVSTNGWQNLYARQVGLVGTSLGVTGRYYNALVGARWQDGHCAMQDFRFTQRGDGETWLDGIQIATGAQIPMPCAIVENVATSWEGAAQE